STPVSARTAADRACDSSPGGVRKGRPESDQSREYSRPCASRIPTTAALRDSTVLAVENRKLKSTTASPGITLLAPVPAWMFETCQEVGGKNSLPSSQRWAANSASAGAGWWTGLRARWG